MNLERGEWCETNPKVDAYVPTYRFVPLEGSEETQRTPIMGDVVNRLDLEVNARYTSVMRTNEKGQELTIAQQERMLDY